MAVWKKNRRSGKIMIQYLISYLLILLLPSFYGYAVYQNGHNQLSQQIIETNRTQLQMTFSQLEQQFQMMDGYSQRICRSANYSMYMTEKSGYNRYQLVLQLYLLQDMLPDHVEYGLWDSKAGKILTSDAVYGEEAYCDYFLNLSDQAELSTLIQSATKPRLIRVENDNHEEMLIYLYPMSYLSHNSEIFGGSMFFTMKESTLLDVLGQLINVDGSLLISLSKDDIPETDGYYSIYSTDHGYQLSFVTSQEALIEQVNRNLKTYQTLFFVMVLVSAALSVWMSYTNAQPIVKILTSLMPYERNRRNPKQNELGRIDDIIGDVLDESRDMYDQLNEQSDILRQQTLTLLLSGRNVHQVCEDAERFGIPKDTPAAFVTLLLADPMADGKENDRILMAFSGYVPASGVQISFLELDAIDTITAIICLDEDTDRREEIAEQLLEHAASRGITLSLNVGSLCHRLKDISTSLNVAVALGIGERRPLEQVLIYRSIEQCTSCWQSRNSKAVMCMNQAVISGNTDMIPGYVCKIMDEIRNQTNGTVQLRCACYELLNDIIALAKDCPGHLMQEIEQEIQLLRMDHFEKNIVATLQKIAQETAQAVSSIDEKCADDLIKYVQKNALNADMCLDGLVERFGISVNKIGHIMRTHTGYGFREYLIYLRMSYARERLGQSDSTISCIAEDCGYNNTSYFIKTFKDHFGMTPTQYRKQIRNEAREND